MAISGNHYRLLKEHAHLFKRGGALLEIGEANWYGDEEPEFMVRPKVIVCQPRELETARKLLDATEPNLFEIAKAAYESLFAPSITEAVDLNGTPSAFRQDLNGPLNLQRKYDVVINHGTAEHVFNIPQVFKSMHDATVSGGYMIHDAPFTGWIDHGFYCLQPTLYYDLAAANEYELVSVSVFWIGGPVLRFETREQFHGFVCQPNACLFVVMRKVNDKPFRIPMQGVYDGRLSEAGQKAWMNNR